MIKFKDNKAEHGLLNFAICLLVVGSIILYSLLIYYSHLETDKATEFCNSISMQYDYNEGSLVCYEDYENTRYIINIIEVDGKYKLLASGELYR